MVSLSSEMCEALLISQRNFLHHNTRFFAQQLAERDAEEHRIQAAQAFLEIGELVWAFETTTALPSEMGRYLHGVAALLLGDYAAAETAFIVSLNPLQVVNGEFGLYQMGIIYEKRKEWRQAAECFGAAYAKNEFIFDAWRRKIYAERRMLLVEERTLSIENAPFIPSAIVMGSPRVSKRQPSLATLKAKTGRSSNTANIKGLQSPGQIKMPVKKSAPKRFHSVKRTSNKSTITAVPLYRKIDKRSKENVFTSAALGPSLHPNLSEYLKKLQIPLQMAAKGDCRAAMAAFSRIIISSPKSFFAHIEAGRCAALNGAYEQAEGHFAKAAQIFPLAAEGKEYLSSCLWSLGRTQKLATLASTMFKHHPLDFRTWMVIGNCFSALGDHISSRRFFVKAINLNPENAYAHCLRGYEEAALQDFPAAKQSYIKSLELDPLQIFAHWGLGNIALKTECYPLAISHFSRALQINPNLALLHTYLGIAFGGADFPDAAAQHFSAASRLEGASALNSYHYAHLLQRLGRFAPALEEAQLLLARQPLDAATHVLLGKIYSGLEQFEAAQAAYLQALSLDPEDAGSEVRHLLDVLNSRVPLP